MKAKSKLKPYLLIAPLITIIWLLIIYFVKGIYPFGSGTIIDCDLYQGGVPSYFYMYDAWHSGNLFYDFTTAGGFGRSVLLALFSFDNLFLVCFKREMLINAISLLLILKLAIVSFTSSFAFSKIFEKLTKPWIVALGVMYAFCGYNMLYFTNISWLDTVALYPLIICAMLYMFRGKSKIPFFAILTYLLIFNTYMSFFVVISLIVFGGLYIFIIADKSDRKNNIYSLGVATLTSLAASFYPLFQYFSSIFGSSRFGMGSVSVEEGASAESSSGILDLLNSTNRVDIVSLFMFLGAELAVVSLILLWLRFKKNKNSRKYTLFFTLSFLMLIAQVIFKCTDLFWHGGSYVMFPMRNGYMVGFLSCLIVGYYISRFDESDGFNIKNNILKMSVPIVCAFSLVIIVPNINTLISSLGDFSVLNTAKVVSDALKYPLFAMVAFSAAGFLLFKCIKSKPFRTGLTFVLVAVEIGFCSLSFIGLKSDSEKAENYNAVYSDCFEVGENMAGLDELSRVNNPDLSLITNYPYISGVSAVSNWTHTLSDSQISAFTDLGFSSVYTRTLDSGGTAFSKALLRITDSVSRSELDSSQYIKTGESDGGFKYYSDKYTLPLGLAIDSTATDIRFEDYDNTFEYQNAVYESLCGKSGLFKRSNTENGTSEYYKKDKTAYGAKFGEYDVCDYKVTLSETGNSIYYIIADKNCYIDNVTVNGNIVYIPSAVESGADEDKNTVFPVDFNNNVLELGSSCGEAVTVEVQIIGGTADDIDIYSLNADALGLLCDSYSENGYEVTKDHISFNTYAENDGDIIFVPISYDNNMICTVNGENAETVCVFGNFIGIKAQSGENSVIMKYSHKSAYMMLAMIIIGVAVGTAVLLLERKVKKVPKWILSFFGIAFTLIFAAAVTVLYSVPIIFALITKLIT